MYNRDFLHRNPFNFDLSTPFPKLLIEWLAATNCNKDCNSGDWGDFFAFLLALVGWLRHCCVLLYISKIKYGYYCNIYCLDKNWIAILQSSLVQIKLLTYLFNDLAIC